jgi:hypothetical protein
MKGGINCSIEQSTRLSGELPKILEPLQLPELPDPNLIFFDFLQLNIAGSKNYRYYQTTSNTTGINICSHCLL